MTALAWLAFLAPRGVVGALFAVFLIVVVVLSWLRKRGKPQAGKHARR